MAHRDFLPFLAERFSIGMSMKKLKGKFRMSSVSIASEMSQDDWSKYDDRLIDCIYRSDLQKLRETLKKKGVSPSKISRDGQTAMHIAVGKNLLDCVDCLLAERPDLSTTDNQGRTVFHIAVTNGNTAMIEKLLQYSRWNLDIVDKNKMSPLHYAAKNNDLSLVKILLEHKCPLELRDNDEKTVLLLAVVLGFESIATVLIEHGANVNIKDKELRTPLSVACQNGQSQLASVLLSKGAEKDIIDNDGRTLITIASEAGHDDIVELLQKQSSSDTQHATQGKELAGTPQTKTPPLTPNGEVFHDDLKDKENSESAPKRNGSTNSSKRLSSVKYEENSFTSSVIESLMGFDVSSDTISEISATEDQMHMKIEEDRKSLEEEIHIRDKKIEQLQDEVQALRNKLKLETGMRFAAEKEVLDLKSQRDVLMENIENLSSNTEVTFSSEHHLAGDDTVEDVQNEELPVDQDESEDYQLQDDASNEEDEMESLESSNEKLNNVPTEKVHFASSVHDESESDSDSDESVSRKTGYRKKSLGTAKQHIDMLEEHILSLEEDLAKKDDEISDLETNLKLSRELVDLNNNTTVSIEFFNELKNEKIAERSSFKEHIRVLEKNVSTLQETRDSLENEKNILQTELKTENKASLELRDQVEKLEVQVDDLQQQIQTCKKTCVTTIQVYRNNLLALYENNLDDSLQEILRKILKLRSFEKKTVY